MSLRSEYWAVLAGCLLLLAGCGKPRVGGPVSGKVLYNGTPLPAGAVTFHGPEGRAVTAEIEDGRYEVRRAPLGTCAITVLTVPPASEGPAEAEKDFRPPPGDPRPRGKYVPIPGHYNDPRRSGLSFAVTAEPQTHDIKLEPPR